MNIVAKPNEWSRQASAAKRAKLGVSSARGAQFKKLWTEMEQHFRAKNPPFPVPPPKGMNWVHVPLHPDLRLILSSAVNENRGKVYAFPAKNSPAWFEEIYGQRESLNDV